MAILRGQVRSCSPVPKECCWELKFCSFSRLSHFSFQNLTYKNVLNTPKKNHSSLNKRFVANQHWNIWAFYFAKSLFSFLFVFIMAWSFPDCFSAYSLQKFSLCHKCSWNHNISSQSPMCQQLTFWEVFHSRTASGVSFTTVSFRSYYSF